MTFAAERRLSSQSRLHTPRQDVGVCFVEESRLSYCFFGGRAEGEATEEARLNVKGEERGESGGSWRRPASRNISFAVNEA